MNLIPAWTLENYRLLVSYPTVVPVLLKTLRIAATVTLIAFLLGYPFAHFLAFKVSARAQTIMSLALIFPFLVGVICRTYAWRVLLGTNGAINSLLMFVGVIEEPLASLLFSEEALQLVLVYNYLLFMVFPIFLSMQRIDRRLFEASADLGAGPITTFLRVSLPLSTPGVMAGAIFVFISACAAFVEPTTIGGPKGFMFANLIALQFGAAYQWPLGGAMGLLMLLIVAILCTIFIKLVGLERIFRM